METKEIPRPEWSDFLDSFSKQHEGSLVTVEVLSTDYGDQILARDWPLQGVSWERKDTGAGVEESISVVAGDSAEHHATHTIASPASVRLAQSDEGVHTGLQIQSDDGMTTLLTFRSPMSPDMYDR